MLSKTSASAVVLPFKVPILRTVYNRAYATAMVFAEHGTFRFPAGRKTEFAQWFALAILAAAAPAILAGKPVPWLEYTHSFLWESAMRLLDGWNPGRVSTDDALYSCVHSGVAISDLADFTHRRATTIGRAVCRAARRACDRKTRSASCLLRGPICREC
ncbi:MAG: hypothetical protein KGJ62_13580 [Armatimonadetes bacterium]|nr:hypothetical protein [Armatimonadota bacterium]MDE2206208.1 hypothetical protein [Armatimonadota bacterium]